MGKERKIINKKFMTGLLTGVIILECYSCATKCKRDISDDERRVIETITQMTTSPYTTTTSEESANPYWAFEGETRKTTTTTTSEESVNPYWAFEGQTKKTKATTESTAESTKKTKATTESTKKTKATTESTKKTKATTTTTSEETVNPYWAFEGDSYERYLKIVDTYNKINNEIDNFSFEKAKNKAINYSKQLIDFIFYGGTINGLTFDQLKSDAKQEVYIRLQKIDSKIMEYIPDYKERIGAKYNVVKNFAGTTLQKAKEMFNKHISVNINVEKEQTSATNTTSTTNTTTKKLTLWRTKDK